ncbi:MAG: hypothetical protein KBT27_09915 [Prevotellaceae bacterium]|nr:hypothetical protein [Candidatus Faecinaster equi]
MSVSFNSVINSQLQTYIKLHDWQSLLNYLQKLSGTQFRSASAILPMCLSQLDNDSYWDCFLTIVPTNTKAYLMTFLKATLDNYNKGIFTYCNPYMKRIALWMQENGSTIDIGKTLNYIFPLIKTPTELNLMSEYFKLGKSFVTLLVKTRTMPAYYCLFRYFQQKDLQAEQIRHYCMIILKQNSENRINDAENNRKAYNFVSMVKHYFDIKDLNNTFSLQLQPYELSLLDKSYDNFCKVLNRI